MERPQEETTRTAYAQAEGLFEWPMLLASVAFAVLLVLDSSVDLSPRAVHFSRLAQMVLWGLFVLEYAVLLGLAPDRRRFVRTHLVELVVIACPVLRVARLARLLRILRVAASLGKAHRAVVDLLVRRGASAVIGSALFLTFAGAGLMVVAEGSEGGPFASFGNALWWAFATVTTVGYGDMLVTTPVGRTIAVVLMVAGVSVFGVVSASIAALFVKHDAQHEADRVSEIGDELRAIRAEVAALRAALGANAPRVVATGDQDHV